MSSSKPGAGLALTHTDLKPLLPDEQHRAKAQKCPLPSLPAHQVAFIVSPGNYLCCLESPGGWEGSLVLSTSWSPHSPTPSVSGKPAHFCLTASWTIRQAHLSTHNSLRLNWYPSRPTISLHTVLNLPRASFLFGTIPLLLYILDA